MVEKKILQTGKDKTLTTAPVISVIDDDESMRAGLNNLVRSLGYDVFLFASADGFLRSAQLRDSRCGIVDVRMPLRTGKERQSHLRSQGYGVS